MKIAIHHNALKKIIKGEIDQFIINFALSSKISMTPPILAAYHSLLSDNPIFTAWFSNAQVHKRINIVSRSDSPNLVKNADAICEDYGTASYFAGSNLLLSHGDFNLNSIEALKSIGTNFIYDTTPLPNDIHGDNPFHIINTKTHGTINFDCLNSFILPEEQIVIYDRYINNISIELIQYVAKNLKPNSKLHIYHSDKQNNNLLSSHQILQATASANHQITVTCQHATKKFTREHHDRYIFFGNRCQANFSAGLDCFGQIDPATGMRKNRKSMIAFFDTSSAANLTIDGVNGLQQVVRHYSG